MPGPSLARSGPRGVDAVAPVPWGRTARRLRWSDLPPAVRARVEGRFGTRVVSATTAGAGYTPGLAATLLGEDGRRMFLKAASRKAQRPFADAYALEARRLRTLPAGLPVPPLLWCEEDDLWVLLGLAHVEGANPRRPWVRAELDRCLDTLELLARATTPPPTPLTTFAQEFAEVPAAWDHVRREAPDWPHLEEAAALANAAGDLSSGSTLVHTDVRDDNLLLTDRAPATLCDWNFPVVGAGWVDTVHLLVSVAGDGLDADALLAQRALTRDVPAEAVDAQLALLAGYFLERRDQRLVRSSPHLRRLQDWYAEATWAWLARRRGWS